MRNVLALVLLTACSDPGRVPIGASPLPADAGRLVDERSSGPGDGASDSLPPALDAGSTPRMGATAVDGGVEFRLWAAAARAVTVVGDFGRALMLDEGDGIFAVTVNGAAVGNRYRFELDAPGGPLTRMDPYARHYANGWCIVVDPSAFAWTSNSYVPPPHQEVVLYEMHVGAFAGSEGRTNGTFETSVAHLDKLADLGINAIELMPVAEFGGVGWGYNPKLWHAPNSAYGTPDHFRQFVDEAHRRGIMVVLDLVYNHYDGWKRAPLYCFDGNCPDGGYGPFFFTDPTYAMTPWGPRPNYDKPQVRQMLLSGLDLWLHEYRVDGFRWDSVSNIRGVDGVGSVPGGRELIVEGNARSRARNPGALTIAEDLKGNAAITAPESTGGFGFDAQWDGFVWSIGDIVAGDDDDERDIASLRNAVLGSASSRFNRVVATETHDTAGNSGTRLPTRIAPTDPTGYAARKRSMLAAGVALTIAGLPMLLMGQEQLETGTFANPPAPIDWSRNSLYGNVRDYYRSAIGLRRNLGGTTRGLLGTGVEILHAHETNKVLAYRRWNLGGDDVVVGVNLRNRTYAQYNIGVPSGGVWKVRLDSDDVRWSSDFSGGKTAAITALDEPYDGQPFKLPLVLGPWSIVVLSRDP